MMVSRWLWSKVQCCSIHPFCRGEGCSACTEYVSSSVHEALVVKQVTREGIKDSLWVQGQQTPGEAGECHIEQGCFVLPTEGAEPLHDSP